MSILRTVLGWRGNNRANLTIAVGSLKRLVATQAALPINHYPILAHDTIVGTSTALECANALIVELERQLSLQVSMHEF